jgi:S-adenosylmethionine hydrolase
MPTDAVYLAVVDPGVGSSRRAVAVRTRSGALLVGPDNGLLSLAADALGGLDAAVEITSDDVILQPRSATFDGRDVFAPATAHLATGGDLAALGPEVPVASLVRLDAPRPVVADGQVRCAVLSIDRFGNVQLSAMGEDLVRAGLEDAEQIALHTDEAGTVLLHRARTFSDVRHGQAALIVDSAGRLAAAVNGGSLAEALRIEVGEPVVLSPLGSR